MTKQDISQAIGNISTRHIAEAETYFDEGQIQRLPARKFFLVAAIVVCFLMLTAFGYQAFSARGGDALVLSAVYQGGGIVSVQIENQSDRDLKLEPAAKLFYYSNQKPVESTGVAPFISDLTVSAHTTAKIRLDLRRSYDVEQLEQPLKNDFYCLQLTNDRFLLGQRWTCMISFKEFNAPYTPAYGQLTMEAHMEGVLPSLRAYYQNFTPDVFARWADAFEYMQLVEEELSKVDGNIIRPSDPWLLVDCFDSLGTHMNSSCFDGYNKIMGRSDEEKISALGAVVPTMNDAGEFDGGIWYLPVFYLYCYAVEDIGSRQDYAFIRGNLLTFEEMEPYKVFQDEEYVVYEMHHLFYSDLRTYVEDMLFQRDDVYFDDAVWRRIVNFYNRYSDRKILESSFYYLPDGRRERNPLSMEDVIEISRQGKAAGYDDLLTFAGSRHDAYYRYGVGIGYTIDDDYELYYSMHMDGTEQGYYLYHIPTGDRVDIRTGNVEAFVAEHDPPEPRCECADVVNGWHGWHLRLEWVLEQGKAIADCSFHNACCYDHIIDERVGFYSYPVDENYYVEQSFHRKNAAGEWEHTGENLCLVHIATGDRCDLLSEDAYAFVQSHGGLD